MNLRTLFLAACLSAMAVTGPFIRGQQIPSAVVADPDPDPVNPASMEAPDLLSHGARLNSVLYLAAGAGPHPTVLLLHGFPGNEQNMDLAYSVRRFGWNVLVSHYRGSWGSEGSYSFTHALEDTQVALQFLRDPGNAKRYRIDAGTIVLIGHSVGGFLAAQATAQDSQIAAVAMLSAGNLGPSTTRSLAKDSQETQARFRVNASRLAGTTSETLLEEVRQNAAAWDYLTYVSALKDRPVLIVEADDRNTFDNQALAAALKKAGDSRVTETHMATDHPFSDHRIALQAAVVGWLQGLEAAKTK